MDDMTEKQRSNFKATKRNIIALGRTVRAKLVEGLNGMDPLLKACHKAAERKSMRTLDGRYIAVPSKHSSLNTLLQHLGGILAKVWMVRIHDAFENEGLIGRNSYTPLPTDKVAQMLWIHDEVQMDCDENYTEQVSAILERTATMAGEDLNLRVKVDASSMIGSSWKECH